MTQAIANATTVVTLKIPDPGHLGASHQAAVDALELLERKTMTALRASGTNPKFLLDESLWPAMSVWMGMRKRAIALHPLHTFRPGALATLGDGLDPGELRRPLIGNQTAIQLLEARADAKATYDTIAQYDTFLTTGCDPTIDVLFGAHVDAQAIRWRAAAAQILTLSVANEWNGALQIVSLGCGAAGPTAELTERLVARGHEGSRLLLVDHDPIALALGQAIGGRYLSPDVIDVQLRDLFDVRARRATPQVPHIGIHTAHLVDMLGIFEYLPDTIAIDLLGQTKPVLRRDGALVLGNMVRERPGQVSFDHVIQWPRLKQRTIDEVLALIARAGFDPSKVTVARPPWPDAVYAVFVLRP